MITFSKPFRQSTPLTLGLLVGSMAFAGDVTFKDPAGDDFGPGTYTYPTDSAYLKGAFDLTQLKVGESGGNVRFDVDVNAKLNDPWGMGVGFATQMIFVFIDTGHKSGPGHTEGLPGLNIQFAPADTWDKVVILSPQPQARVLSEVRAKAQTLARDIVVPRRTTGSGRTVSGTVKLDELGGGDPAAWGYQVVMQSNEGFPDKGDLLTRKVNEYEGQHRFGGGNDGDCDPHVMDVLAGRGRGDPSEIDAQKKMLGYECGPNGESVKRATLTLVRK